MNTPPFVHHRYVPGPEVDSFYHLRDCDLTQCPCYGTACFVARNSRNEPAPTIPTRVYCFGRCFESPAVGFSDHRPSFRVDAPEAIVLSRLAQGGARTLESYRRFGGYRALEKTFTISPEAVIDAVVQSGLRGRGGAGFLTGVKWQAAARESASPKFVVANADEGDPGAYIDRFLIEDDPHALIEGMAIAGYAIGATKGWIYLRREYPAALASLQSAILEARDAGILGASVLGSKFQFDLEVSVGHGSYVCGEETAMLNSMEGRRPDVTARPPYATHEGLFGQPTIINNIETFITVPWIIEHGGDAYHSIGFARSRGTKVVSLNSLFARPGLYEVEFGVPVRHIVEDLGGGLATGELKGLIIGGPLAGLIPPHLLDTPFGFEELAEIGASVGHGGTVAFDHHTSIAALVHHVFSFGAFESCGKCTPCRLGSRRVEELFGRILADGAQPPLERIHWEEIVSALKWTSLCGHGVGLGAFAESVLRYYEKELAACFA